VSDINADDTIQIQLKDGRSFALPFLDTKLDLDELREKHKEDATDRAFLDAVVEYVRTNTGQKLTRGEACNLFEGLILQLQLKKKAWQNAMLCASGLPVPSDSTPSGSPPTNS
jgi:hypothetical protein